MYMPSSYPPVTDNPCTAVFSLPTDFPCCSFDEVGYEAKKEDIRRRARLRQVQSEDATPVVSCGCEYSTREFRQERIRKRRRAALMIGLAVGMGVVLVHPATRAMVFALGGRLGGALPGSIMGALADHIVGPSVSKGLALVSFPRI